MDFKAIEQLIQAIDQSNLTSVEIEEQGLKIALKKEKEKVYVQPSLEQAQSVAVPMPSVQKELYVEETTAEDEENSDEGVFIVKSPIVGTFYEASGPDAEPYVKVGDRVKKGDILCIVEAMKLMNEIESEVEGTIEEIIIDNEQMVEYHQPIMKIRK